MIQRAQRLIESIQEQAWFQQLRAKWDELDAQSKIYLQWAGSAAGVLLVGWIFFGTLWQVHRLKSDIQQRDELIRLVQSANEEMSELKSQIPSNAASGASTQSLKDYLTGIASTANVPATTLEVAAEKAGSNREGPKETLAQVTLKKVNVSQMIRFIFQMENGSRPIKLRNLSVETHSDQSGYLDVILQVSSFTLKTS